MNSGQAQLQQQIYSLSFTSNLDNNLIADKPPRPESIVGMDGNTMPLISEGMGNSSHDMWSTPTSEPRKQRPATIHEGFSICLGAIYDGLQAWDSSGESLQTPSESMSRPISVHQDFFSIPTLESNNWTQEKPCEDGVDKGGLDTDMNIGQALTADDAIPIFDLQYSGPPFDSEALNFEASLNPRRMSGSSFTMSTSGGFSDIPSYEEFSAAFSDAPSLSSDYPPRSNRNSMMSSTQLSPVASPRMTPQGRSDLVRTQSRGRASPSPRPGVRAAPYTVDSSRNKRWSTGSYATASARRPAPFTYHHTHDTFAQRMSSRHSSPTVANTQLPLNFGNLQAMQQQTSFFVGSNPLFPRHSMLLPSQLPSQVPSQVWHPEVHQPQLEAPAPLLSHGLFRMLQSNADPHSHHGHYADLSDPPDLYASLQEEQIPPPPEDMNPSDQELVPHEQDLRFEGDLYTPKWVRGHGNKREGWCGICKPGRWLVLKNSAFWYDKSFTHGISAATGNPFQEPQETRRMDGNPDVWEGLCGSCNEWIALVSSKKKGTTWFRHAYKCHTHPKIKDAPKRRRESSNIRGMAMSTTPKLKTEPQVPSTPLTTSGDMSLTATPTTTHLHSHPLHPSQQATPTAMCCHVQMPMRALPIQEDMTQSAMETSKDLNTMI